MTALKVDPTTRALRDEWRQRRSKYTAGALYGPQTMMGRLMDQVDDLEDRDKRLRDIVDEQAEDGGLWFQAITASEAYLQQGLRRLHAAVES